MTSEPTEAYVWTWLPGQVEPVVCGRLVVSGTAHRFGYGRRFRERGDAVALYLPELRLSDGFIDPLDALDVAGVFADAAPDAWGQRVIETRRRNASTNASLLTLLLESGSDRIGALDFQASPEHYEYRGSPASLEELLTAAEMLDAGETLPAELDAALLHGSSVGGARPKAVLHDGDRSLIAKFSSTADVYPVVKAEAAAMALARRCGLDVAHTELVTCLGRDVLLVERFDRGSGSGYGSGSGSGLGLGQRRSMVSALTILELPEHAARHATYADLADQIRARFTNPGPTLRELFGRIVFNIAVSNTDDHARNHAAFWDGHDLTLTPAYDICPQHRTGGVAAQAMAVGRDGSRWSQFSCCVDASDTYHLDRSQARDIVESIVTTIQESWNDVADEVRLSGAERVGLWGRQVLNPFAFEDAPDRRPSRDPSRSSDCSGPLTGGVDVGAG